MSVDSITGLLDATDFEERLSQALKQSERYQFTLGLMCVGIDDFDVIKDALGEAMGNQLLEHVARRLEECVRQVDSLSRRQNDTFAVLLTQLSKPETAAIAAQRILQSLSMPFQINDRELYISVCIGVSLYPADAKDAAQLHRNADHALHLANADGHGVCRFYEEKIHQQSQHDLMIYNSLSRESVFNEFSILYQPVIDVSQKSVFCMDVLLQWDHPELGVISSKILLECAEKQRKLNALSEWLLRRACEQFLFWRKAGTGPQLLGLPLSIKQLENSRFVYQLSLILQQTGMPPECLLVEIKDNFSPVSFDILEKAFNMFHYLGVKIAMDGFGAGSFNLSYLKKMTIHYIRLDRQFVDDIVDNEQTRALVASVLFLAETMKMRVMVQGVATVEQRTILRQLGATLLQGPLFGGSLTADKAINFVFEENI